MSERKNRSNRPFIGLFSLILLITVSIDSVRNLPSTALFGPSLIFLYLVSSLFMLIPGSIAAAEFAYAWPEKGGIYQWVSLGLGKKIGFFAVWGQWVNTLVWFPTILSFVAGSIAFIFFPKWAANQDYIVLATLVCFWILTALALLGFHVTARFATFCSFFGLMLPMAFIIVLAIVWLCTHHPLQVQFTSHTLIPSFHSMNDWFSLIVIMTSFEGFELVAVHMSSVKNPKKNYPRAMFGAVVIILVTMVMGSLAIAIIIPSNSIVFVEGVAQAFGAFLDAYHMKALLPIMVILMTFGNLGEMINWLSAPARGLFQSSEDHFLPPRLHKQNRFGAEKNLLLLQAVIISLFSLIFLLLPSVNGAYWFLTNLSVEIYMVVYLLMFMAAIAVEYHFPHRDRLYGFMKKRSILLTVYTMGVIGCIVTLFVGAFPPTNVAIGSPARYQLLFWAGIVACVIPIFFAYAYRSRKVRLG